MFRGFKTRSSFPVFFTGIPSRKDWVRINEFHGKYTRGDYSKIAENTGYSPSYVWRVLNGERGQNQTILAEARRVVYRRVSPFTYELPRN